MGFNFPLPSEVARQGAAQGGHVQNTVSSLAPNSFLNQFTKPVRD